MKNQNPTTVTEALTKADALWNKMSNAAIYHLVSDTTFNAFYKKANERLLKATAASTGTNSDRIIPLIAALCKRTEEEFWRLILMESKKEELICLI